MSSNNESNNIVFIKRRTNTMKTQEKQPVLQTIHQNLEQLGQLLKATRDKHTSNQFLEALIY